jgi:hypothetical protein
MTLRRRSCSGSQPLRAVLIRRRVSDKVPARLKALRCQHDKMAQVPRMPAGAWTNHRQLNSNVFD